MFSCAHSSAIALRHVEILTVFKRNVYGRQTRRFRQRILCDMWYNTSRCRYYQRRCCNSWTAMHYELAKSETCFDVLTMSQDEAQHLGRQFRRAFGFHYALTFIAITLHWADYNNSRNSEEVACIVEPSVICAWRVLLYACFLNLDTEEIVWQQGVRIWISDGQFKAYVDSWQRLPDSS